MGFDVGAQRDLIINADDYGFTAGVNRGIEEAMQNGIVASTSCLVYDRIPEIPWWMRGRVGVHLRLTDGRPALPPSQVDTLVDAQGLFPRFPHGVQIRDPEQIRAEWQRQIELFREGIEGALPSHLDTHHLVHRSPVVFEVYASLCEELGVAGVGLDPEQVKRLSLTPDYYETRWEGGYPMGLLYAAFEEYKTVCLMTHPGYVDDELRKRSTFTDMRYAQLRTLLDPRFRTRLEQDGIRLIDSLRTK